jgi:hypothetical protein
MLANCAILLTAGSTQVINASQLDALIRELVARKKNPVLVLGPDGDDLLRSCQELEACDLVFDPNYEGDYFSGIKAGLHAVNGPAFVIPVGKELLPAQSWGELELALLRLDASQKVDVLRPVTPGVSEPRYPQIVTSTGLQALKRLPASTTWSDSQQITTSEIAVSSANGASGDVLANTATANSENSESPL